MISIFTPISFPKTQGQHTLFDSTQAKPAKSFQLFVVDLGSRTLPFQLMQQPNPTISYTTTPPKGPLGDMPHRHLLEKFILISQSLKGYKVLHNPSKFSINRAPIKWFTAGLIYHLAPREKSKANHLISASIELRRDFHIGEYQNQSAESIIVQ